MCKFLHAAFRHFGDQWSWEDGGNGSGVGGILERLSPTGHNFEGIIAELAEYFQQRDPVEVYTLRDGQRYPEGTWQLTSIGKVRVQDGEPLKKNKCQVNEDVDEWGNCYSSAEGSEGHPWFNTTLFYFSWWWNGVPPELTAKYPELEGSFIDEWVAAAESEHQFGRTPRDFFKLLTGPLARGIGAYNSKFLFSDEYVLGRRRLADCTQYTPVGPTGATQGLTLVVPDHVRFKPPRGQDKKVKAIRFLTAVANTLIAPGSMENRLRTAVAGLPAIPVQDTPRGRFWLHLYDVQVALCELSRWLRGGGSSNRRSPREHSQKRTQVTLFQCHTFMSV